MRVQSSASTAPDARADRRRREGDIEPIGAILPRLLASFAWREDSPHTQPSRPLAAQSAPAPRAMRAAARG